MNRSTLLIATAAALAAVGPALAQSAPLAQALESVGGNLANDPDNPGLNRAHQQLMDNQQRIQSGQTESGRSGLAASQGRSNGNPGGRGGNGGGGGGGNGGGRGR